MSSFKRSVLSTQYSNQGDLKVALVYDWLTGIGGAERVVLELHKIFPDAPIYTSQYDPKKIDWFKGADVRTGWLQKLPKSLKKFMPVLRAWYFSHLDLSEYDLIISNTGAEAKAVKFGDKTTHISIVNAPTHYYWSRYDQYIKEPGFGALNWLARIGLKVLVGPMRKWDYKAAQRPTKIIAISTHIQSEIKKYYSRESEIIFPPVNIGRFQNHEKRSVKNDQPKSRIGFVITGRQTPYKRIDLAVSACTKLDLPLTVIGSGPEHEKLVKIAGPSIEFKTNATDEDVVEYLSQSQAFIFPGVDDFGISPVEALAIGTPVIAFKAGGALDYVIPGKTGEFFNEQTIDSLCTALKGFDPNKYSSDDIKKSVLKFSSDVFEKMLTEEVNKVL